MNDAVLDLHLERGLYAVDCAVVHGAWFGRFFHQGRDELALKSFDRFVALVRQAEAEVEHLRAALKEQKEFGDSAAEYREQRERHARLHPAKQKPSEAA